MRQGELLALSHPHFSLQMALRTGGLILGIVRVWLFARHSFEHPVTHLLARPGQSTYDLLRQADTAMYRAKRDGRNRIAFFEEAKQAGGAQRLA